MQEGPKPGMEPLRFGVRLSSLQTERTGKGSLGAIPEVSWCTLSLASYSSSFPECSHIISDPVVQALEAMLFRPLVDLQLLTQGMQVIKDMRVDGLSVYWCPAKHLAGADPDSPIAAWLGSMEQSTVPGLPPDMHDILPSLSFDLRLTTKYGEYNACLTPYLTSYTRLLGASAMLGSRQHVCDIQHGSEDHEKK